MGVGFVLEEGGSEGGSEEGTRNPEARRREISLFTQHCGGVWVGLHGSCWEGRKYPSI
jgi:hypothetical protein